MKILSERILARANSQSVVAVARLCERRVFVLLASCGTDKTQTRLS